MYAYDRMYLEKGRNALGRMLDFAVNQMKYDIDDYFDMFMASGMANRFEKGDVSVLVGRSGVELARDVLVYDKRLEKPILIEYTAGRSAEYWAGWAGWALAYYQWFRNISFAEIVRAVPLSKIVMLYSPYHEMDIRHFVDKMNELCETANATTKLKRRRMQVGLSQSQLAEASEVAVRTIQQYEQRQKDINKANVTTLANLAKVLYCSIEDLLE